MKDAEREYQSSYNDDDYAKNTQIAVEDNCDNSSTNNKLGKDSTIYTIYGNNGE